MFRVGIIGPESTGKSTLATYLAERYDAGLVSEYAREYMESLAPSYAYTYDDVVAIAQQQVQQMAAQDEHEVVFYDTELIITKVWFLHKFGRCPDFLLKAIEQYPMDVYLLCYPDMPWQPDPVRENPMIREYLFDWYEKEIQALRVPYYIIKHS
jgi:NadR type nicotinamide-nucleotide adenylyltransferase